jgi:ParE toxin of type II toxin-antitoxin system, parDE
MAEIAWTNEAKSWLQQIYDYIARDNEEAAWQVILGIYERVQILRDFPESGHRYQKYPDKDIRPAGLTLPPSCAPISNLVRFLQRLPLILTSCSGSPPPSSHRKSLFLLTLLPMGMR